MSKKTKGIFRGGDLKLNREIKKEREAQAKEGQKGFIGQLRRADDARHKHHQAESKHFTETQYRGQDTVERPKETAAPEKNIDPSTVEAGDGNTGFSHQVAWNANNPKNR